MLLEVLVEGVKDLHLADERECEDILTEIWDFSQLVQEVSDARFDIVVMPHLDSEKMVVVPLSLLTRCVLGEEHLVHLFEIVERL